MEELKCASIKYRKLGEEKFKYINGPNHAFCINQFNFLNLPKNKRDLINEVQGFMTNKGRFVDRKEALEIAKISGQVEKYYSKDYLMSEFVLGWSKWN